MTAKLKRIFQRFVAFFIKDGKGYQASFKFALATFAFETLITLYTFFLISSKVRFRGVLSWENSLVVAVIVFFLARVFVLHFILAAFLRGLESLFAVQWRKSFYASILSYAYLFLAIKYPQNFDEFPWISFALKYLRLFENTWVLFLPVMFLFLILLSSFIHAGKKTLIHVIGIGSVLGILAFYLIALQKLHPNWEVPSGSPLAVVEGDKTPNIIFITVDSLRGDTPLETFPEIAPELKDYLSRSWGFDRVVSPLAQTHSALASLFTAQNPTSTGVRTNLSKSGLHSDSLFVGSPLEQLKEQGYEVRFIQDVEEYANFNTGKVISHIQAPDFSVANVIISTFFKNRVVYGLFNNPLGYFFLPELKNNTSFFYSYDLPRYTTEVLKELQSVQEKKNPVFLFIHTCSLHWPAVLPYPFYPQEGFPEESLTPFSYTSKFRGLSYEKLSPKAWNVQAEFNSKIYRSALKMTVEDFLNPVFNQIQRLGLDKNSIVVLLSDHGEDLWDGSSRFPKEKFVQHGSSLIFGASSELSFLRMQIPNVAAKRVTETVGTIDLLPTVMDFAGLEVKSSEGKSFKERVKSGGVDERHYYSETGLWPLSMFRGQFVTTPASSLGPLFSLNSETMALYVDPKFLPGIVQQKQRAVYYKNYRLTLYPTDYGYQEFLCDRNEDFQCVTNLIYKRPEITAKMRVFMQEHIEKDVKSGLLKIGACSPFSLGTQENSKIENIAEYQWQYYFQALECLRTHSDYSYSIAVFDKLLESADTTKALKSRIERTLLDLCSRAAAFNKQNLPTLIQKKIAVDINELDKISFPYTTHSCLMVLGDQQSAKKMADKFQLKITEETTDSSASLDEEDFEEGSHKEFRLLLKKFAVATVAEKGNLLQQLKSHSKADFYSGELDIARFYEDANGDTIKLQTELDDYFKVELNYQLVDYLEKYYFVTAKNIFYRNPDEGLLHILRQLSGTLPFPMSYFNFMLFKIDSLIKDDSFPSVSSLRFRNWNSKPLENGPFNLRRIETALALVKGQRYFCKSAKTPSCLEVQNFVTKLGAQKIVDEYRLQGH